MPQSNTTITLGHVYIYHSCIIIMNPIIINIPFHWHRSVTFSLSVYAILGNHYKLYPITLNLQLPVTHWCLSELGMLWYIETWLFYQWTHQIFIHIVFIITIYIQEKLKPINCFCNCLIEVLYFWHSNVHQDNIALPLDRLNKLYQWQNITDSLITTPAYKAIFIINMDFL